GLRSAAVVLAADFPITLGERSLDQVAGKVEQPDMRWARREIEEHGLLLGADIGELRLLVEVSERCRDVRAEAAARHQLIGVGLDEEDVRRPPEDRRFDRTAMGKAAVDDLRVLSRPGKVSEHPGG